jgi:hypothetical protein
VCDPRSSSTSCLTSFLPTSASTSCLHWQASSSSFQHTPPPFDKPRPPALLVTHRRSTPGWRLGTENIKYKPWISLPPPSRQSKPNIHHQAPSPLSSLIHGPVRRHPPSSLLHRRRSIQSRIRVSIRYGLLQSEGEGGRRLDGSHENFLITKASKEFILFPGQMLGDHRIN